MNIVVTVKEVLDPSIPPDQLRLDEADLRVYASVRGSTVINGYDENALEEGLRLRERYGGQVTALSVGGDSAVPSLRRSLAMGVDAALLLRRPNWEGSDSHATATVLAAGVEKLGRPDVILCGRQASDTDAGQVSHYLAEMLGFPSVAPISKVENAGSGHVTVRRITDGGYQVLRVGLPAVVVVSSEINEPRYPTAKGLILSKRALIPTWYDSDLGLSEIPSLVSLVGMRIPTAAKRAQLVEAPTAAEKGAALADKLHELGLV